MTRKIIVLYQALCILLLLMASSVVVYALLWPWTGEVAAQQNGAKPAAKPVAKPAPKPEAAPALRGAADASGAAPGAPQPKLLAVENAQKVGVKACLPLLAEETAANIDNDHATTSTWSKEDPDHRIYSALSFLTYPNDTAPRALVATVAAPTARPPCDGATLRIQPTKLACEQIATNLANQKSPAPELVGDVRLYPPAANGLRIVLMPAASSGCVVISSGTFFGR
jgi:hypothetical protein